MSEWISVSDGLPPAEHVTVAVITADGDILTAWATYWHGAKTGFACWSFPHGEDDDSVVTHWCRLPEIPE